MWAGAAASSGLGWGRLCARLPLVVGRISSPRAEVPASRRLLPTRPSHSLAASTGSEWLTPLRRSLTVSRRHGGSPVPLPGSVYEKQASGSALSQGGIVGRRERQKWGVTGGHLRAHSPEQPGYCPRSRLTPRRRPEAPSDGALGKRHAFVDLMLFFVGPVARRDSTAYPGFPGGAAGKNSPANAGDTRDAGSIPGLGRCPGGGNGSLRKYSCLENPMGRGTWWATDRGVSENRARLYTQLSRAGTSPSVT